MKINPIFYKLVPLLCLFIAACAAQPTVTGTPTPTQRKSTATYTPSHTPAASTTPHPPFEPEPPEYHKAQVMLTPGPKLTLTPLSLRAEGPWQLLLPVTNYTGSVAFPNPLFSNQDASVITPPNIPENLTGDPIWWNGELPPKGPYVAFQTFEQLLNPFCVTVNDPVLFRPLQDQFIYILKLPENTVVRQIQLFGLAAIEQINQEGCELKKQNKDEIPPALGVVLEAYNVEWSPDGRYMAFSAAIDGPASDLYLYDTQDNEVRRLTFRQNNPKVMGWSPDSQTVLYYTVARMASYRGRALESSGLYAISISGTERLLLKPQGVPHRLEWLSQAQFIINDLVCSEDFDHRCGTKLHRVDLSTGAEEIIYQNPRHIVQTVTDPINHLLLFLNPPSDMLGISGEEKLIPGIFLFDFEKRILHLIREGENGSISWDEARQVLRENRYGEKTLYQTVTTLFYYTPEKGFTLQEFENLLQKSPDGLWAVGEVGKDPYILDAWGNPRQKLRQGDFSGGCGWSPDSSMYIEVLGYRNSYETQMVIYSLENNWEPVLGARINGGYLDCVWIVP